MHQQLVIEITLKLTSLGQAEVIANAIEHHIDCEEARRTDAMGARKRGSGDALDWTRADDHSLECAKSVLKLIRGGK